MLALNATDKFRAEIITLDGVTMCTRLAIDGRRASSGEGLLWRGEFVASRASCNRRPLSGENLYLRLDDGSQIGLVVTELVGDTVHFRARGKMPEH